MSDIVERLRSRTSPLTRVRELSPTAALCREAAAEIERLRNVVQSMKEPMKCECGFTVEVCATNLCMRKKVHSAGLTPGSKWPEPAPIRNRIKDTATSHEAKPFMMLSCREAGRCLHNLPGCICEVDPCYDVDLRLSAVIAADWVPSKETEGPNGSGYYTAGIDIPIKNDPFGPRLHYSAIEFHCKDKAEAERRRDAVLAALTDTGPQAAPISVAMDALVSVGNQDAFLDMPRYTRNLVNRAIEKLAGVAEQSGAGAPETSVRCGAPAATTPPQGARK